MVDYVESPFDPLVEVGWGGGHLLTCTLADFPVAGGTFDLCVGGPPSVEAGTIYVTNFTVKSGEATPPDAALPGIITGQVSAASQNFGGTCITTFGPTLLRLESPTGEYMGIDKRSTLSWQISATSTQGFTALETCKLA